MISTLGGAFEQEGEGGKKGGGLGGNIWGEIYIVPATASSPHGIRVTLALCLGTSNYCLVIVLHAVMTYDRSIGTREAGSGKFCITYGSAGPTRGAPARQWSSAVASLTTADPWARSAGLTRGSAENNSRVMMA